MIDCSGLILSFHDKRVTLPQSERTTMRERRDSNRRRLIKGLEQEKRSAPTFKSQGSYAMKTMLQHPQKAYDIDDGVYFKANELVGPRGGLISALDARRLVCDAVDDGRFNTPPEVRKNCVRVLYNEGYHVDLPVYRRLEKQGAFGPYEEVELASNEWTRSDARDVTAWFTEKNRDLSPDEGNGRQMRRIVRLIKRFARSRESWKGSMLCGFGISVLIAGNETQAACFRASAGRDDVALFETMRAIRDRLNYDLVIWHPCTPNTTISRGTDDAKARFLREKLDDALDWLRPIHDLYCDKTEALKAWGKVFNTSFFEDEAKRKGSIGPYGVLYPQVDEGGATGLLDGPRGRLENGGVLLEKNRLQASAPLPAPRLAPAHRQVPSWPIEISGVAHIERCVVTRNGFRPEVYEDGGGPLPKHAHLTFHVETNIPRPFKVYWQIVNTGIEAERANGLRGGFDEGEIVQGKLTRNESTLYYGDHTIECFIIKNGTLLACTSQFMVRIR